MKKRIVYFDYLRTAAILSVIVLHTAAKHWNDFGGRSFSWNVLNFYDGITRWGVPVFVMISGALFLSREIDLRTLYKKNILRLASAYFAWAAFYALAEPLVRAVQTGTFEISLRSVMSGIITGQTHTWFIPMIAGLYMCVPILRQMVRSETVTRYYLLLSFVFACVVPQITVMSGDFVGGWFAAGIGRINQVISGSMDLRPVLGYSFYFVLGYRINSVEFTKKQRRIIYLLGAVGFVSTVLLNAVVAWKTGVPCQTYYGNFRINVLLEAVSVHTWFRYREYRSIRLSRIVPLLAKYSFGAYLIHIFVLNLLSIFGVNALMCSPVVSVPAVSLLTAVISFAVSCVIHRIPVIRQWIV